jgi:hypothetical protein
MFLGMESQWGKGQWHVHDLPTSNDELKNMLSGVKEGFSSEGEQARVAAVICHPLKI